MNNDFSKLPANAKVAALVLLGFAVFVTWDQSHWWALVEDYSFGYLVPMFVAYVLYERWPLIKKVLLGTASTEQAGEMRGSDVETEGTIKVAKWFVACAPLMQWLFGLALALGLLFILVGALMRAAQGPVYLASMIVALGFVSFVFGVVYTCGDVDASGKPLAFEQRVALTLLFLFPALIWLLSTPMLGTIHSYVKLFLLGKVVAVVFFLFELVGLPLIQEGNVLVFPKGRVGVEEACSGIRSLTACLFAGSFLAAVFLDRFWKKVMLVGLAMVFAFVTNMFRSLFLTGWAYAYGSESISGKVHDIAGYSVLGLTCAGLLLLLPVFNFELKLDEDELKALEEEAESST